MKITELPNKVINKINSATIDYLVTQGIITGVDTETAYYETIKDLTLVGLLNGGAMVVVEIITDVVATTINVVSFKLHHLKKLTLW